MVLFEIHQRFKGHFLGELRVSFKNSVAKQFTFKQKHASGLIQRKLEYFFYFK